ncbi:MAG: hypothetical protein ACI9DM_002671 [Cyclobacteriaceae bacterium]|jgi:hypothetical protein
MVSKFESSHDLLGFVQLNVLIIKQNRKVLFKKYQHTLNTKRVSTCKNTVRNKKSPFLELVLDRRLFYLFFAV